MCSFLDFALSPKYSSFLFALNLLMQFESRRQRCFKVDWFAGDGVGEF
jgi:hypothetical protein